MYTKIKCIAVINGVVALLHLLFWVGVFLNLPPMAALMNFLGQEDFKFNFALGIADLIWSVPLLVIAYIGLQKHRLIGWLAAQVANVLWGYSFTLILFQEFNVSLHPITMLFLPCAFFSIWSSYTLWKFRSVFLRTLDSKN